MKQNNIGFWNKTIKRTFDIVASFFGLCFFGWLILISWMVAATETRSNGFFTQKRIGQHGKSFHVIKIKTMYQRKDVGSSVTTKNDMRITKSGRIFRQTKIDELPQLINVLLGQMSFVGPRPDVPGFLDSLAGEDRIVMTLRPGITGPATLHYRNEEELLAQQSDPEKYNRETIFPHKVQINKQYIMNYSLWKDLYYIYKTVLG